MSHFEKCCQNNWREEKKGPPLTLHTPRSTAFVLGRIMLFDSADKGKHPFSKSIKEKSLFLNVKSRQGGCSPPQLFPTPKLQDQTQAPLLQSHSASNNLGERKRQQH